jgi:DNA-binding FadR family transcriptional regulator
MTARAGEEKPLRSLTAVHTPEASTRSRKRSELIAETLQSDIVRGITAGTLAVGDRLPSERELMDRFSVARPTLREAMRILEASSLVELRVGPRGGAYVRAPKSDVAAHHVAILLELRGTTLEDVWELRAVLEPLAVLLAGRHMTAAGVKSLRTIIATAEATVHDTAGMAAHSVEFLDELVRLAENQTLSVLVAMIHDLLEAQSSAYALSLQVPQDDVHKWNQLATRAMNKVVSLLEHGEEDAAEAFWREHMNTLTRQTVSWYGSTPLIEAMALRFRS